MIAELENLLSYYERGAMSRRQLVAALAAVATPAAALAASPARAPLRAATLNHVTLAVSDVERSRQFYTELLAMPIVSRQANGVNLGAGSSSFVGLYDIPSPRIHHFCLGVDNFDADSTLEALEKKGIEGRIRLRDDVKELYFQDPDGIQVQLQGADYRG